MSKKAFYEVEDLFGNSQIIFPKAPKKPKKDLFGYDDFVDKFKDKKTTDDCYTPKPVFDVILNYLKEKGKLIDGQPIIRPFFPNNDYKGIKYPLDSIVVDNPPFSIFTQIVRYYLNKDIPFFLFGPHLTLLSVKDKRANYIVVGADVTYENGAVVKTSFVSNLFGSKQIFSDLELHNKLNELNKKKHVLPKYEYPDNLLTVSDLTFMLARGIEFEVDKKECFFVSTLDDQKKYKKSVFGNGVLMTDEKGEQKAEAKRQTIKRIKKNNTVTFRLSDREKQLLKQLSNEKI